MFFPPCLVICHDKTVEFNGPELIFELHGDGLEPQQHPARNNSQPGSFADDGLHQCSSVIHPHQMVAVTFHIIMETTAESLRKDRLFCTYKWGLAKIGWKPWTFHIFTASQPLSASNTYRSNIETWLHTYLQVPISNGTYRSHFWSKNTQHQLNKQHLHWWWEQSLAPCSADWM